MLYIYSENQHQVQIFNRNLLIVFSLRKIFKKVIFFNPPFYNIFCFYNMCLWKAQYFFLKIYNVFNAKFIMQSNLLCTLSVIIDSFKLVNLNASLLAFRSYVYAICYPNVVKWNLTVVLTNAIRTSSLWARRANIHSGKQSGTRCIRN